MKARTILSWTGGLLAAGAFGAAALFGPALLEPAPATRLPGNPTCDLQQGPCAVGLPDGGVLTLDLHPRPIPVMRELNVEATFEGVAADEVAIDFNGVNMNMGINHFLLDATGGGRFTGKGALPVCVRDRMEWEALVSADTDGGRIAVPFRFETLK